MSILAAGLGRDLIAVRELGVDVVVGILPSEQVRVQRLWLEVELEIAQADLEACAESGDLSRSVNYADTAADAAFLAEHGRWRLLESLGLATLRWVLAEPLPVEGRAAVRCARWAVRKPEALGGKGTPSLVLERESGVTLPVRAVGHCVSVSTLVQTPIEGAYRVVFAPGAQLDWPLGLAGRVVAGGVSGLCAGAVVPRGAGLSAEAGPAGAVLLAVGAPSFV